MDDLTDTRHISRLEIVDTGRRRRWSTSSESARDLLVRPKTRFRAPGYFLATAILAIAPLAFTLFVSTATISPFPPPLLSNILIDTSAAATDNIDYVATDNAGNTATSRRSVIIDAASGAPDQATSTTP